MAVVFFYFTKINSEKIINLALEESINSVKYNYKNIFYSYESTSTAISKHTMNMSMVSKIISQANDADEKEKNKLRVDFSNFLQKYYKVINKKGVSQYQFVLANGESFYRFHSPEHFGDNIFSSREDFKQSIQNKSIVRGFVVGKFSEGFRNVFPIFYKKKYIGSMEVSFSSIRFQKYLNNINNINSHILIHNSIMRESNTNYNKYETSYENANYLSFLPNKHHDEGHQFDGYENVQNIIDTKIQGDAPFVVYSLLDDYARVLSFVPIKNTNDKTVAWIASYTPSFSVWQLSKSVILIRVIIFAILALVLYFLINQVLAKAKINKQKKILSEILNRTKNIMFITNLSSVRFRNKKFNDLIPSIHKNNILDIFINSDGFLHQGLLKKNENFISLIERTPTKNRIVSIFDKNHKTQSYIISVAKLGDEYLITLSNVTDIKEELLEVAEKAYIDDLTKVFNRNKFNEIFELEIKKNKRSSEPLSVALIDIDHFKLFNDTYGHLIGDEVLIKMAQTVQYGIRETDTFARWGGEEFILLFTHTNLENAVIISNKIRESIENDEHKIAGKITASFGITQAKSDDTMKSIFQRCDDALYKAKNNGRNRVEIS